MTSIAQEIRIERASAQFDRYEFRPLVEVASPNGATYVVDPRAGTCTCPDFTQRCADGGSCKHVLMVDRFLQGQRPQAMVPVADLLERSAEEETRRRAAYREQVDRDFPLD